MDLWVVAAAAGAGYVTKFLQKSKEKESLVERILEDSTEKSKPRPFFEQLLDNSCPVRKFGRGQQREEEEGIPSYFSGGTFSASEVASTSGFDDEMLMNNGSNEDYNILSLSSLSPRFTGKMYNQENEEDRIEGNREIADKRFLRSKRALTNKGLRPHYVKPLSSLDSCLMAQLYNEHVEMEEYVFSAFPSPSRSVVRPLLVTDGSRIISRASSDSCSILPKLYKENGLYSDVNEKIVGVPILPGIGPLQLPKKPKQKSGKGFHGRFSSSNSKISGKQFHSQGSHDRMFLFCLGITFGVMSTVMANKREVNKLNELLKQTENLVQDLHEELEMKDSLTVKVLAREGSESEENCDPYFADHAPTLFSSPRERNESLEYDIRRIEDQRSGENSESRCKIEAELEAELERLELNMNASSLQRKLFGIVKLDPDANIVQGELMVDMVNGGAGNRVDSDREMSGTSTTKTENANYAVSPRELSLRLHEVIQSRLEERVIELETALENSQKRLQSVESKQINSWRNYSNSEMECSSQESPTVREESNDMTQPLFLTLSDDALDAYNEAYAALNTRINEENSPTCFREETHSSDHSVFGSDKLVEIQCESDEDDDDGDDELGRLLIKQIVEKTRQGSPVVLNAQRMLFQLDQNAPLE